MFLARQELGRHIAVYEIRDCDVGLLEASWIFVPRGGEECGRRFSTLAIPGFCALGHTAERARATLLKMRPVAKEALIDHLVAWGEKAPREWLMEIA